MLVGTKMRNATNSEKTVNYFFININHLYLDLYGNTKMHINSGNFYVKKPEIRILLCIQTAAKNAFQMSLYNGPTNALVGIKSLI
jgi:hypothetical protein